MMLIVVIENTKKGVRNLRFLTTLVPQRHVTVTYLAWRQLALNNGHLPLFPTLATFLCGCHLYTTNVINVILKNTPVIPYYLFPLTQQVETKHETATYRNLRQSAASAIFCQVLPGYGILPNSTRPWNSAKFY